MQLVIVSGRSGSGKSVALRVLEDLGYYCVDNLPYTLLPTLLTELSENVKQVAVSMDVRNAPLDPDALPAFCDDLAQRCELTLIYLDASDAVLTRRFSETRRLHPLTKQNLSLGEALEREHELLLPIADRADLMIDSSELTIYQLSNLVQQRVLGVNAAQLVLVFESFGFKYGLPQDADYVFDARFLPNPHWEPHLRPYTGLQTPVQQFFSSQPIVNKFILQISSLLNTWLPLLQQNNRSYLTVAIGCTGGQHRSVYIVEQLANQFRVSGLQVQIRHRELDRSAENKR